MNVLIINRKDLNEVPYHRWLPKDKFNLFLVTTEKTSMHRDWYLSKYEDHRSFAPFRNDDLFGEVVSDFVTNYGIDSIIALSELDILRAARARSLHGLPGQNIESAKVFRDKIFMKRRYIRAGLKTPAYSKVTAAQDIWNFFENSPGPAVLKLRRGAASKGIFRLGGAEDAKHALSLLPEQLPENTWLIERFIDGRIFHVDGLVENGAASLMLTSEYLYPPLDFQNGSPGGSIVIDNRGELSLRLRELAKKVIASMPFPEVSLFHLDIYEDRLSGELYCGEIAARAAGNRIMETFERASTTNLEQMYLQKLYNLDAIEPICPTGGHKFFGVVHVRRVAGTLIQHPAVAQKAYMHQPVLHVSVGDQLNNARSSVESLWSCLCEGDDEALLRDRCLDLALEAKASCTAAVISPP